MTDANERGTFLKSENPDYYQEKHVSKNEILLKQWAFMYKRRLESKAAQSR